MKDKLIGKIPGKQPGKKIDKLFTKITRKKPADWHQWGYGGYKNPIFPQ